MYGYCSERFIYMSIEGILYTLLNAIDSYIQCFFCVKNCLNWSSFIQKELIKCLLCVFDAICSIINLFIFQWSFTESFLS